MYKRLSIIALSILCAALTVSSARAGKPAPGPQNTPVRVTIHDDDDRRSPLPCELSAAGRDRCHCRQRDELDVFRDHDHSSLARQLACVGRVRASESSG